MVLIDTSIWVGYLRGTAPGRLFRMINKLIDDHDVAITPVVRLELLRGSSPQEATELQRVLNGLHELPFEHWHWQRADRLVVELRTRGLNPSLADLLIAVSALEYQVPVYHQDKAFDIIARYTNLEIYRPKP